MARVDVEIEDYLDEVDTKYLVKELQRRKDWKSSLKFSPEELEIPDFDHPEDKLRFIKHVLGLRQWHDKERIIQEIKFL